MYNFERNQLTDEKENFETENVSFEQQNMHRKQRHLKCQAERKSMLFQTRQKIPFSTSETEEKPIQQAMWSTCIYDAQTLQNRSLSG